MPDADTIQGPLDLPELLARSSRGDDQSWRRLIELYGRRVYALAHSRCRRDDVAEEITQSVFVTLATKLSAGGYTEQGRFESWLFRVTMNRVRDEARRQRRHAEPTDPEVLRETALDTRAGPIEGAAERAEALAQEVCLRRAMDGLSNADREVIELRHHGGLSFQAIADALEEPVGTVLARHHRALRKLKDAMTRDGEPSRASAAKVNRRV